MNHNKFWHISKPDEFGSHKAQAEYFRAACEREGVEYVRILEKEFDVLRIPDGLSRNDIVYRSARGVWAEALEKEFVTDQCRHAYVNARTAITGKGNSYYHLKRAGVPHIPSIPFLPNKKRQAIAFAEHLGGFPLVIKVLGGMEGVGVIRVDSIESFNSVVDFIKKDPKATARVMQFIPHDLYARLVVVGDEVVAATCDEAPLGDFRANARGPRDQKGRVYDPNPEICENAVESVRALGVKAGGVDVLIANDGHYYISEVNMPFNFAETQRVTGIDIAHKLVQVLMR